MHKWHATLALMLALISMSASAAPKVTVFAAASLSNAISDIAKVYQKQTPHNIQTSYAASSALARQIEHGAPVDIFISADTQWMAYLQQKNLIEANSQVNLLGNELVLIAPRDRSFNAKMRSDFNLDAAFEGKLCTGDTNSVPAGIYAKQALQHFNWWASIRPRIVAMQDVRAALVSVERGECAAGIVYATDAKASSKVRVVADFPPNSHAQIVYPLALVKNANPYAQGFYQFLMSDQARQIFNQYGFSRISIDKRP